MTIAKPLASAILFIFLASCQSVGMSNQTIAYNEAVAESTNQFFLLNVLRARDHSPIYYTHTTGDAAAQSVNPSVTFSLADHHLTPGMTIGAAGSNTASLANLDDLKSMRGVLTPVPLSALESYVDQGWPRELLYMMFIKKIEIAKTSVATLVTWFKWHCKLPVQETPPEDYKPEPRATELVYCAATLPVLNSGDHTYEASPVDTLELECLERKDKPGYHSPADVPGKNYVFDNYPPNPKQLKCFQAMLRVLLALGLAPTSGPKFSVIVPDLQGDSITNLRGISEAVTAKLAISLLDKPVNHYAVCTKSDSSGFTLDASLFSETPICKNDKVQVSQVSNDQVPVPRVLPPGSRVPESVQQEAGQTSSAQAGSSLVNPRAASSSCKDQVAFDACTKLITVHCNDPKHPEQKDESICQKPAPAFKFTTRSLDSMIYYLGEIVRAGNTVKIWTHGTPPQTDTPEPDSDAPSATPAPQRPVPLIEVPLFLAEPGGLSSGELVSVDYHGDRYVIPNQCPGDPGCDQQNRSLQVFALLNQIWGLQKEASEAPSVPVVSVINSH